MNKVNDLPFFHSIPRKFKNTLDLFPVQNFLKLWYQAKIIYEEKLSALMNEFLQSRLRHTTCITNVNTNNICLSWLKQNSQFSFQSYHPIFYIFDRLLYKQN